MPNYAEGATAYRVGVRAEDTPYFDTQRRIQWLKGWCDSKRAHTVTLESRRLNAHLTINS